MHLHIWFVLVVFRCFGTDLEDLEKKSRSMMRSNEAQEAHSAKESQSPRTSAALADVTPDETRTR